MPASLRLHRCDRRSRRGTGVGIRQKSVLPSIFVPYDIAENRGTRQLLQPNPLCPPVHPRWREADEPPENTLDYPC